MNLNNIRFYILNFKKSFYIRKQIIDLKTFYLIGSLATIDQLLIFLRDKPNNALNFRALCESSVFDTYTNETYISEDNPSFFIFNKDSVDFDEVPNLY